MSNIRTEWHLFDSLSPTGYAQILGELSGDPAATSAETAYLAGLDLARVNSIGLDFIGYDGHGSVREFFDTNGDVVETYTYDILLDTSTFIPQPCRIATSTPENAGTRISAYTT